MTQRDDRASTAGVPDAVTSSIESQGASPASATNMRLDIDPVATDTSGLRTRAAHVADLPAIAAIYNDAIRARQSTFETAERTVDALGAWLDEPVQPCVVAELDGRVVGWARAGVYRPRACYDGVGDLSVYVASSHRGRGVGRALLEALVHSCVQQGFWKLVGRVFPENTASLTLFERGGFRVVGVYESHGRLDDRWRDVVIVERLLPRAGS